MIWLSRASRARQWRPAEWALLAEAWAALLVARVLLRWQSLPALLARLKRSAQPARNHGMPHEPLARAVLRATHLHPVPMACLPQSIALAWMLARRGQPCTLLIGARPEGGTLAAHAWVERADEPINSPPDSAHTHPVWLREAIAASR